MRTFQKGTERTLLRFAQPKYYSPKNALRTLGYQFVQNISIKEEQAQIYSKGDRLYLLCQVTANEVRAITKAELVRVFISSQSKTVY